MAQFYLHVSHVTLAELKQFYEILYSGKRHFLGPGGMFDSKSVPSPPIFTTPIYSPSQNLAKP